MHLPGLLDRLHSVRGSRVRPTVTGLCAGLSLRVRLVLLVSLATAAIIAGATYLQIGVSKRRAEDNLRDLARRAALDLAAEFQTPGRPFDPQEVNATLHASLEALPAGRVISVVMQSETVPRVFASTSSGERPETLSVARRAIESRRAEWDKTGRSIRTVAVPFTSGTGARAAVVVAYSAGDIDQVARHGRLAALWLVPIAIIALAVLVDLMLRRFVHRPIAGLREAVQSVARGNGDERVSGPPQDEIGSVMEGLTQVLGQMQSVDTALQERVGEATEELRTQNAGLVNSYQRLSTLQEALRRAEEMAVLDQTIASVAHQMGTPLNVISGYVQMIREGENPDSAIGRRLKIVEDQIGKVTSVLRTMVDHPHRSSPQEMTSPARLVEQACEVLRPKLERANVRVDIRVADAIPDVKADAMQLELALLNLITYGLDAMPSGGTLTIAVSSTGSRVRVEVGDTGPGIAPELLPRVFDLWVATNPEGRGSGLGLSIAKNVVEAHGGSIDVRSEPGQATVFTMELPAAAPGSFIMA